MLPALLNLMRQMDPLFAALPAISGPDLSVADQGAYLLVTVPLQGIDPRSVQLQATETMLAIAGEATREERTEGATFFQYRSARSRFIRQLPLPCRIDPEGVLTRWNPDGTLSIWLPKRPV